MVDGRRHWLRRLVAAPKRRTVCHCLLARPKRPESPTTPAPCEQAVRPANWLRCLRAALAADLAGLRATLVGAASRRSRLYCYEVGADGAQRRLHLRIDRDGSAVLLVDVTEAIHLNRTAAAVARLALDGATPEQAWAALRRSVPRHARDDARRGVDEIFRMVNHLRTYGPDCPTCGLDMLGRVAPFSREVHAPYKADVALTYACNNACGHCYNPPARRAMRPLDETQWRDVISRLAQIGVPHLVFTGGEPTLVDALPRLVAHARQQNLVVGLNTNGRRLAEPGFAASLAAAGLDHVQITLESHRPEIHDAMTGAVSFDETVAGIRRSLAAGLHTITNTTLTRANAADVESLVDLLHSLGLRTIAANGMIHAGCGRASPETIGEEELAPILVRLRDRAMERSMRLLWYTPTAYCRLSPLALELGPRRCNAAEYSICVEPNGDVLPCQSYYEPAGNLLADRWKTIWSSPLFTQFRRRTTDPRGCGLPERCWQCHDLSICAGGCPLQRQVES
jgi:radical SAM protein with 4Fe4S-binding SPASM domain